MTYEEARELVAACGLNISIEKHDEVLYLVLKALDKQIQKKPIPHKVDIENVKIGNVLWGKNTTVYRCPCCDDLISRAYDYCYKCGQALDWNE